MCNVGKWRFSVSAPPLPLRTLSTLNNLVFIFPDNIGTILDVTFLSPLAVFSQLATFYPMSLEIDVLLCVWLHGIFHSIFLNRCSNLTVHLLDFYFCCLQTFCNEHFYIGSSPLFLSIFVGTFLEVYLLGQRICIFTFLTALQKGYITLSSLY